MTGQVSLKITQSAVKKIQQFAACSNIADEDGDICLRIDVIGGAVSGLAYDLYFDAEKPDDIVVPFPNGRLLISADVGSLLNGVRLDWVEGNNGAGFNLNNPNEPEKRPRFNKQAPS